MPLYRERLWPAVWLFIASALLIPASILVLAPISLVAGIVTAIVLYGACVAGLFLSAPVIEVADGALHAGRAHISIRLTGSTEAFTGQAAWKQRGPALDVRAWLLIRGWVDGVVKVPLLADAEDPAPYWLISSRRPKELAAAIEANRH